jgi:hypothetical protein
MKHKCKCGAKWIMNHPHGKKSRGIKTVIKEHKQFCKHNRKPIRRKRR